MSAELLTCFEKLQKGKKVDVSEEIVSSGVNLFTSMNLTNNRCLVGLGWFIVDIDI